MIARALCWWRFGLAVALLTVASTGATAQDAPFRIELEQNGRIIPVGNHEAILEPEPFVILVHLSDEQGVWLSASLESAVFEVAQRGGPFGDIFHIYKVVGEKPENADRDLDLHTNRLHYFDRGDGLMKFDEVVRDGTSFVGRRTIERFFVDGSYRELDGSPLPPLHLVFVRGSGSSETNYQVVVEHLDFIRIGFVAGATGPGAAAAGAAAAGAAVPGPEVPEAATSEPRLLQYAEDGRWGYIDAQGEWVIPPRYEFAESFREGRGPVKEDGSYGFIDASGELINALRWEIAWPFFEGRAAVRLRGRWGFVDRGGTLASELIFEELLPYSEGLAPVKVNGRWGFLDLTGQLAIDPQFDRAGQFSEGLALAEIGQRWGYIDKSGRFVVNPRYNSMFQFTEDLGPFFDGESWGYLDGEGNVVITPRFQFALPFSEGKAGVKTNDLYGYIDNTGEVVIAPRFAFVGKFSEGLAPVQIENKWGYIDSTGEMVIEPRFNDALGFEDGIARVKIGDLLTWIRADGTFVRSSPEISRYQATDGSFSYIPPPGWELVDNPGIKYKGARGPLVAGFFPSINIVDEEWSGASLDEYADLTIEEVRRALPGATMIDRGDFFTQSEDRAVRIVGEAESQYGQHLRVIWYLFDAGDRKLAVSCITLAGESSHLDELFDETMKSFRLEGR